MSYRKVGGIHFLKVGRFGCSFHVSKSVPKDAPFRHPGTVLVDGLLVALVAVVGAFVMGA